MKRLNNFADEEKFQYDDFTLANYFINIHSEFCKVFEKDTFAELNKIIESVHFVGLYFDAHFYDLKNVNELCQKGSFEKELLEKILILPHVLFVRKLIIVQTLPVSGNMSD